MIETFLFVGLGVEVVWRNVAWKLQKCCEGDEGDDGDRTDGFEILCKQASTEVRERSEHFTSDIPDHFNDRNLA